MRRVMDIRMIRLPQLVCAGGDCPRKSRMNEVVAQALAKASLQLWMVVTPQWDFHSSSTSCRARINLWFWDEHITFYPHAALCLPLVLKLAGLPPLTAISIQCNWVQSTSEKGSGVIKSFRHCVCTAFEWSRQLGYRGEAPGHVLKWNI